MNAVTLCVLLGGATFSQDWKTKQSALNAAHNYVDDLYDADVHLSQLCDRRLFNHSDVARPKIGLI